MFRSNAHPLEPLMSDTSPVLALPYIKPSQAQKHVTHNEALRVLDAVVQLSVLRADLASPPATPAPGARYIVAATATDAWEGMEDHVAIWDEAWILLSPRVGWTAYVEDTGRFLTWDGGTWRDPSESFETLERLGLNATADATNRLAVASPASLFSHEGAGHQIKVNKAGATETASLLFQTGFSGRAEMGTLGSDGFGIKVSDDGNAWVEAMTVDPATGRPALPQGATIDGAEINGQVTGTAVQASPTDETAGKLMPVGAFGLGGVVMITDDLDNDRATGLYYGFSGAANRYSGNGYLLHQMYSNSFAAQLYIPAVGSTPNIGMRRKTHGSWGNWANILPEGGQNANGAFVRFPDGTQICTTALPVSATGAVTWTFPAGFTAAPRVMGGLASDSAVSTALCVDTEANTTAVAVSVRMSGNTRVGGTADLLAIGRWT
jgi:hypothetical protein